MHIRTRYKQAPLELSYPSSCHLTNPKFIRGQTLVTWGLSVNSTIVLVWDLVVLHMILSILVHFLVRDWYAKQRTPD